MGFEKRGMSLPITWGIFHHQTLFWDQLRANNKHFNNDWPRGKQKVLFPRNTQCSARLHLREHWDRGESQLTFSRGTSHQVEKNCEEIFCLRPTGSKIWSGFKEQDLITCESQVQVAVSLRSSEFCSPYEVSEFWPKTSFPPIGKRIWVERYKNIDGL